MVESTINLEAQQNIKNSWNSFAPFYDQYMHLYMLQPFTSLLVHTHAHLKKRILEVACGSGMHTLYLAKTMLQKGAALVSTDISEEMIKQLKAKFEDKDSEYLGKGEFKVEELRPIGEKTFDIEAYLGEKGAEAKDRYVLSALANNESLPFTDASFDCYIANLSLMLVDNYKNMLTEALRVTQPGSTFGFTVWGRRENIQNFEVLDEILVKHDLKPAKPPAKTPYDLGKDPEALRAVMEGMGFKKIRVWYQHMNFNFKDADQYASAITETVTARNALAKITPEQKEVFMQDIKNEYNKRMGSGVLDPRSFEVMIITAEK